VGARAYLSLFLSPLGFSPDEQKTWVLEMAPFVSSIDPYGHPISTSFCCHNVPEVFDLPSVGFTMTHTYGTHNRLDLVDNNHYWSEVMATQYDKPTYIAGQLMVTAKQKQKRKEKQTKSPISFIANVNWLMVGETKTD
jgi:hypothetical protein